MRLAVASPFGCGAGMWSRLKDEGADVRVWIDPSNNKTVGDGIVQKAGQFAHLLDWCKEGAIKGEPVLMLFDGSGLGEKADDARKAGIPIIGGGTFCDKLEKDRSFGQKIAQGVGIMIPPHREFPSIVECAKYAESVGDLATYFKSDRYIDADATHGAKNGQEMAEYLQGVIRDDGGSGKCILQEKIEGVPLSTARWWNGMTWVGPYESTYENKKFMNDDIGPSTGCALNVVWFYQESQPKIAQALNWEGLTMAFRQNDAPPGLYDINAVVDDEGKAWFLEWTPRFGWDSEPTSTYLFENLCNHLYSVSCGLTPEDPVGELAYAVRLTIPPYPWEFGERSDKHSADGHDVLGVDGLWEGHFQAYQVRQEEHGLVTAGPEGIVGLSLAAGSSLEDCHEEAMEFAHEMRVAGLQYRTDGLTDIIKAAEQLGDAGMDLHPGLLE